MSDVPWRRHPEQLRDRVVSWLARTEPDRGTPTVEIGAPGGSGMSSETLLLEVDWPVGGPARYVARLAPDPEHWPVFPTYDLDLQRRCMELVRQLTDVPVPVPLWFETDAEWLGAPFLVMTRIEGAAPADVPPYVGSGWLLDASPAERAQVQDHAVGVLAALHTITEDRADLRFLARPEHGATALDQHLGAQRAYYEWARGTTRYPLIERAFAWLEARRPVPGPTVLNWGDARIGNILFQDLRPTAVLDWEMACLGPAEVDVAWMIWLHRFFEDLGQRFGLPGLPGFMQRTDVLDAYGRLSGHQPVDVEWYEVFAALRHAIITIRTASRSVAFGQAQLPADPDDLLMFGHLLGRMLDGTYWE